MTWQRRARDLVLAGGAIASVACTALRDGPSQCCNLNPDPCCQSTYCGLPVSAWCSCQMAGKTYDRRRAMQTPMRPRTTDLPAPDLAPFSSEQLRFACAACRCARCEFPEPWASRFRAAVHDEVRHARLCARVARVVADRDRRGRSAPPKARLECARRGVANAWSARAWSERYRRRLPNPAAPMHREPW
jgi:hypothetical protein